MSLLYVHKLSVTDAAGQILLDQVSLDVEAGRVLGIAGGPTAGKTVLCDILGGHVPEGTKIASGRILFGNRDLTAELTQFGPGDAIAPTVILRDDTPAGSPSERAGTIVTARDPAALSESCDEIAVLCAGHLVERGPADELLRSPQHPYTQALLKTHGSAELNARTTQGCPHFEDCSFAQPSCRQSISGLQSVSAEHATACIRWRAIWPVAA